MDKAVDASTTNLSTPAVICFCKEEINGKLDYLVKFDENI